MRQVRVAEDKPHIRKCHHGKWICYMNTGKIGEGCSPVDAYFWWDLLKTDLDRYAGKEAIA